jgi:hypothetical protein
VVLDRALTKLSTAALALAVVASFMLTEAPRRANAETGDQGAGGKAVAHFAGGRVIPGNHKGPVSKLFRPKDGSGAPLKSGEPTLGVTNEDNVFYTAIQGNTRVEVVRSKDDGKSWEIVSPTLPNGRNAQIVSFDPYLYVDDAEGADRIFTIDLTVACAYLSFSDDEGESWTTNPLACGRPVNDHQTLFSGPPAISPTLNYPNVVYYCWNDIGSSSCSKSLDGGITFVPTGTPAFNGYDPNAETPGPPESPTGHRPANCGGLHGHGHVGADGTVYIPKGHCGQPWLAISHDEGATWDRVQVADNGVADHEASVATDAKGNIYYVYIGADRLVYLVTSKDGGKKWSKPLMIAAPKVNESGIPSLDVGGVGKIAVAYMGTTNSPGKPFPKSPGTQTNPDCQVAQLDCPPPAEYANTTWNGYVTISADALDSNPVFYSAPVNSPKDPFKRETCGPGRCGLTILDFIDVVIAPDGEVWSAWVDACTLSCAAQDGAKDAGSEAVVGHFVGGPNLR